LVLIGGLLFALRRRAVSRVWGLGLIVLSLVLVRGFGGLAIDWNDRRSWQSMGNTLYFVGVSVPLTSARSMLLASALSRSLSGIARGRAASLWPGRSGAAPAARGWHRRFRPPIGPIAQFWRVVGLNGPGGIAAGAWAVPASSTRGV